MILLANLNSVDSEIQYNEQLKGCNFLKNTVRSILMQ